VVAMLVDPTTIAVPTSDDPFAALDELLMARGFADAKTLERARRVAVESGQRLDAVLVQLDLSAADARRRLRPIAATAHRRAHPLPSRTGLAGTPAREIPAQGAGAAGRDRGRSTRARNGRSAGRFHRPIGCRGDGIAGRHRGRGADRSRSRAQSLYPETAPIRMDEMGEGAEPMEEDAERLRTSPARPPSSGWSIRFVAHAVETQASDIHIEPLEDRLRLRFRYDGVLHERKRRRSAWRPPSCHASRSCRISTSRTAPAAGRAAQARGPRTRCRFPRFDHAVASRRDRGDARPRPQRGRVPFRQARPARRDHGQAQGMFDLPNGMVLVTGPTGSGKTTTLYTGLSSLDSVARKIVSVEDPIEYQLGGINQIQSSHRSA